MDSSSQILSQIFGQTPSADEQLNFSSPSSMIPTGGRNQYVELERFESEEEFQNWHKSQGRKWGIVQKGRVTIEDIIDQYACVYRRRKGYACRVQMRVRHNRRSGQKVVEVLPIPHDHTFYGAAMPHDMDESVTMVNSQQLATNKTFPSNFASYNDNFDREQDEEKDETGNKAFEMKQELDFSSFLGMDQAEMNEQQQQSSQPMEMLWSNILNNPAIQQFANGAPEMNGFNCEDQQQNPFEQANGNGTGVEDQFDQTEMLANCIAEKGYLTVHIDTKFDSILSAIATLTKNVDELKRSVLRPQQQQQQQRSSQFAPMPMNQGGNHSNVNANSNPSTLLRPFLTAASRQNPNPQTPSFNATQNSQQQMESQQQGMPNLANKTNQKSTENLARPTKFAPISMESIKKMSFPEKQAQPAQSSSVSPLHLTAKITSLMTNKAKFGLGLSLNSPMKSSRKSVHAYRQRRRELSYRFMKELTINGLKKSIFLWRASEILNACQLKRKELAESGKKVIYRGTDITDKLYRVDCSRDLVNGRRCGQMIADSLWPQGYFQTRMLMPILKGVSHRAKKRVNGAARRAVANDQFEIFKVALLLLGGFLMEESDRSKWMETAREGVNQRGLDELANSKRAHYEYEGGPLFGFEEEEDEEAGTDVDDESTEQSGEIDHQEQAGAGMSLKMDLSQNYKQEEMEEEEMEDEPPPALYHGEIVDES